MILQTLDGVDQWTIPYLPNWANGMSATFTFESESSTALTQREERIALGGTLRIKFDCQYTLEAAEVSAFRNALRTIQDTPVRVPFWPANDGDAGPWGARWWMGYTEGETAGVVGSVSWSTTAFGKRVPSLLGYFSSPPTFSAISPTASQCRISFEESSSAAEALTVSSYSWTAGPSVASITRYVFPWRANWTHGVDFGRVEVDVRRNRFGVGRFTESEAYPQVGFKSPRCTITLTDAEAPKLVRWFKDRKGPVEPFWVPLEFQETKLSAATTSGSVDITVSDATPLSPFSYLGLINENGDVITRKILSRVGNVLTLDSSPGDYGAAELAVCVLALVRFSGGDLTVRWNNSIAEAEIAFTEVSQEYAAPVGETIQASLGDLPDKAFVYDITHGSDVVRLTGWDGGLIEPITTNAYTHGNIDHGSISEGFAVEASNTTLRFRYNTSNPISKLLLNTATERIQVKVRKVTPTAPWTNESTIFTGYVTKVRIDGAFVNADVQSSGNLMARRVPRILMQPSDNAALFDEMNGLDKADWTFSASVTAISSTVLTFGSITWPGGALPTIGADYFALGYIERPVGADFERIFIVSSTALSAGSLTVTLARALTNAPSLPQSGWSLIPGYDGLLDTADTKFSNSAYFVGFPFVPPTNPSIVPVKKVSTSSGKK